jgi:hypothetical protein
MMDREKLESLRDSLNIIGLEYEHELASQFLRDNFPEGIPAEQAIEFVKEKNLGDELLENSALRILAMVPVPGVEKELLERLKKQKSLEKNKIDYTEIFSIVVSLLYLSSAEGQKEFNHLKSMCSKMEPENTPLPNHWFEGVEYKVAKWKRDRAAGKRWEFYEDEEE